MPNNATKTAKENKLEDCFIMMPVTVPPSFSTDYNDGIFHFKHVLDCLLTPAIQRAGYNPIPPIAKGAELIHARTIKYIEEAPLTICDISTFNPNVFFELGIRTALNKPVCFVMDDATKKIPFDTSPINHYTYKCSLYSWEIEAEIEGLRKHIEDSRKTSVQGNELWKRFGFKMTAAPPKEGAAAAEMFQFILSQIEILRRDIFNRLEEKTPILAPDPNKIWLMKEDISLRAAISHADLSDANKEKLYDFILRLGIRFDDVDFDYPNKTIVVYSMAPKQPTEQALQALTHEAKQYGCSLKIRHCEI